MSYRGERYGANRRAIVPQRVLLLELGCLAHSSDQHSTQPAAMCDAAHSFPIARGRKTSVKKARLDNKNDQGTPMRKITLMAWALLASGTVWAQTESDPLQITSGGTTIESSDLGAGITYAGNGFSGETSFTFVDSGNPLNTPTNPFFGFSENFSAGSDDSSASQMFLISSAAFTGPGTFPGTFSFLAEFNAPTQFCPECVPEYLQGSGIIGVTMVKYQPGSDGSPPVYGASQETFTFEPPTQSVPEPGTLALFAFGLVGLATRRGALVPLRAELH